MTKARAEDRQVLTSPTHDDADRASALDRVLADGDTDIVDVIEPWLASSEFLREQALRALVGRLHIERHVDLAISWLRSERTTEQMAGAQALGMYAHATGRRRDDICRALVATMLDARDSDVGRECYDAILTSLGEPWADIPQPFVLEHVDWSRLVPFLPAGMSIPRKNEAKE